MKDGCAVRMLKNQRSASGVFLGHFSLPLPPSASLLSFWSLSGICSADSKVPFPGLCSPSALLALKNKAAGPVKTDKEKTAERGQEF